MSQSIQRKLQGTNTHIEQEYWNQCTWKQIDFSTRGEYRPSTNRIWVTKDRNHGTAIISLQFRIANKLRSNEGSNQPRGWALNTAKFSSGHPLIFLLIPNLCKFYASLPHWQNGDEVQSSSAMGRRNELRWALSHPTHLDGSWLFPFPICQGMFILQKQILTTSVNQRPSWQILLVWLFPVSETTPRFWPVSL